MGLILAFVIQHIYELNHLYGNKLYNMLYTQYFLLFYEGNIDCNTSQLSKFQILVCASGLLSQCQSCWPLP